MKNRWLVEIGYQMAIGIVWVIREMVDTEEAANKAADEYRSFGHKHVRVTEEK